MMAASAPVAPAAVVATSAADMRMAATAAVVATSAAMTAAAPMANELDHSGCTVVGFFVEDVERRQANVCDFFLTKNNLIAISVARSGQVYCRSSRDRRCGARQRQRQTSGS
jgi:hypothetical protein